MGEFGAADVTVVWLVLTAYSFGLLASTATRVYQSAFFALRDTRTPARVATLRVLTAAVTGAAFMVQLEPVTVFGVTIPAGAFAGASVAGVPLGPVGLAAGAALGAWLEWWLLRGRLRARAHRPLPSMITATCRGSRLKSIFSRSVSSSDPDSASLERSIISKP